MTVEVVRSILEMTHTDGLTRVYGADDGITDERHDGVAGF